MLGEVITRPSRFRSSGRVGSRCRSAGSTRASPSSALSEAARPRLHVPLHRPNAGVPGATTRLGHGGLVLEVKGDFCHHVREILDATGAPSDYVEVSVGGRYRYNPLHNDLAGYAQAYGIATLLNNLYGHGEEPFWQQAYTNLVKFLILLHSVDDYVTLFDVYAAAINPDLLAEKIAQGRQAHRPSRTDRVGRGRQYSRRPGFTTRPGATSQPRGGSPRPPPRKSCNSSTRIRSLATTRTARPGR